MAPQRSRNEPSSLARPNRDSLRRGVLECGFARRGKNAIERSQMPCRIGLDGMGNHWRLAMRRRMLRSEPEHITNDCATAGAGGLDDDRIPPQHLERVRAIVQEDVEAAGTWKLVRHAR